MEYGGVLCETKGVERKLKAGMSMVWIGDNPEQFGCSDVVGCELVSLGEALNAEQESGLC